MAHWKANLMTRVGNIPDRIPPSQTTSGEQAIPRILFVDDQFIVPRGNQPHFLFNAFICATPQHPFLSKVIEHALALIEQGDLRHPFGIVGPSALGQALNASVGASAMTPHRIGRQKKNGLSYRILRKFYSRNRILKNMVGRSRVLDGFSTVLLSSYEGYRADLRTMKVKHWSKKGRVPKNFGTGDLTSTVPEDYRSGIA